MLRILNIWWWLKRQTLMKPSLQYLRLTMIWKFILKKSIRQKPTSRKLTFILKISTKLKRGTQNIQKWRTIYEVIQREFFAETDIFLDKILKHCKNNINEAYSRTCGQVNTRVAITLVRATHQCIRGARVPASRISVTCHQWEDGAGLHLFRQEEEPATSSSIHPPPHLFPTVS